MGARKRWEEVQADSYVFLIAESEFDVSFQIRLMRFPKNRETAENHALARFSGHK